MTVSDLAPPDHVVICCPACGASETAAPSALADSPTIVCRECGETWPAVPKRSRRRALASRPAARSPMIEAERRPLVTYSGGVAKAWAAKVRADTPPEPARRSRAPITLAAIAAVFFVAIFLGGREAAVATLPDLAGFYAALGLPVNLEGLAIEGVHAERIAAAADARLTVRGTIRNLSGTEQPVPPLAASLYDSAMAPLGVRGFDPPTRMIAAGEAAPFVLALDRVPKEAARVVIRLRRTAERVADAGGATTTAQ